MTKDGDKVQREDPDLVCDPNKADMPNFSAEVSIAHKSSSPATKKTGIGNEDRLQTVPNLPQAGNAKAITKKNLNCSIHLMGDRPTDRLSGYGGVSIANSSTIDLCAGRGGPGAKMVNKKNSKTWFENNFTMDSARIYISERTDIDHNFKLNCTETISSENCSAIGIKADSIRIIARKDIKLVAGVDYYDSKGGVASSDYEMPHRICLIGDNKDEDIQPMVKGTNLLNFLEDIIKAIKLSLSSIDVFLKLQNDYNQIMANHTHIVGPSGQPGIVSIDGITLAQEKAVSAVLNVKSNITETIGFIEESVLYWTSVPNDGVNKSNILSNYNFCN